MSLSIPPSLTPAIQLTELLPKQHISIRLLELQIHRLFMLELFLHLVLVEEGV